MGAGVEWRRASFWASDWPDPGGRDGDGGAGERSRKSVARKEAVPVERGPWARDLGHRVGTEAWMALRDWCSPEGYQLLINWGMGGACISFLLSLRHCFPR